MKKLDNQFIPYVLSLNLKELGYKDKTMCTYVYDGQELYWKIKLLVYQNEMPHIVSAPLWQQVFDWFREEHKLLGLVSNNNNPDLNKWCFDVHRLPVGVAVLWQPGNIVYDTYDEAKVACIEKMCEIIKTDGLWECTTTDNEEPTSTDS
jgi:hypothetical protein